MTRQNSTPGMVVAMYIVGMLLTGSLNTLCAKIQFSAWSDDKNGEPELFRKPWFRTMNMMFAMSIVGVCDKLWRMRQSGVKSHSQPLLIDEVNPMNKVDSNVRSYKKKIALVAYPALFDILATALSSMGMMYIPASVWQMLRGSCIVFAAMMSVACLNRKMYVFNLVGLVLCVAGVTLVGVAQILGSSSAGVNAIIPSSSDILVGIGFVLCGQVVQSLQLVLEEFLMKEVDLPPMQIIGWEGIWGTLMFFVLYPLLWFIPGEDHGHAEDIVDTFVMLGNNHILLVLVGIYLFSCATFNATGIAVTASLSAVHRMMLDASRTILIWMFGLWVHYFYDSTSLFGEAWTVYSPLQLVGFVVLVSGQAVYGEVLKLPGLEYPKPIKSITTPAAAALLCSPLPREAN